MKKKSDPGKIDFTSQSHLIKNCTIVNEGIVLEADVLIKNGRFNKISPIIDNVKYKVNEINAENLYLFPGIIDNHVHFREPGLTHKADIQTDSKAAVAGGVTSFMDMPNTNPQTTSIYELHQKIKLAKNKAMANFAFYLGASNNNLDEIRNLKKGDACGVKVFMGSSTGNMLVNDHKVLNNIFANCQHLIAVHAEDESIIQKNIKAAQDKYGENIPFNQHPHIRSVEACLLTSKQAISLAEKNGSRLHILHLTTENEAALFDNTLKPKDKLITTEVCAHYLYLDDSYYDRLGTKAKCNPAIKSVEHKNALTKALINGSIDIICSDHAPHSLDEKNNTYLKAPSGMPMVQHTFLIALNLYHKGLFKLEHIAEKMAHNPAILYRVKDRGFIREDYHADCFLADINTKQKISSENLYYKCKWSPLEGHTFKGNVEKTLVNGRIVYDSGFFSPTANGNQLEFY